MVLTGKQKAAMLLMGLDAMTAAELLKGIDPETVQELAVEVAYLDASGNSDPIQSTEVARQFYQSLNVEKKEGFQLKGFLSTMLTSTIGQENADRIQTQIEDLLQKRDPFIPIRSADPKVLAMILGKEHPQAIAVVLSELTAKKSSEVLGILDEGVQISVVTRLTGSDRVSDEARMRIAQLVCDRLEAASSGDAGGGEAASPAGQDQALRKVAVMLRNLAKEIRDGLMKSINKKDSEAGEKISELMVIWEDIIEIEDRSLQKALREVDSQKLALGLIEADEAIVQKIKSNISERAAEAIDEETSLMASPKKAEIEEAREEIVSVFRDINEKGELDFIEE